MENEMMALTNQPVFDPDTGEFLGLLEVGVGDTCNGKFDPLSEKELKKFIVPLYHLFKGREE